MCLLGVLTSGVVLGQFAFAQTGGAAVQSSSTTSPTAYVYVASSPNGSANRNVLNAYTTDASGRLTAVPGSPFQDDVVNLAVNGKYLFGTTRSGLYVAAFGIGATGVPHWTQSTKVSMYNSSGCPGIGPIILDHTGSTLYNAINVGGDCDGSEYQSLRIDQTTGFLNYLGSSAEQFLFTSPLSFLASNTFAYGSSCVNYKGLYLDTFSGYQRHSNGMLTLANVSAPEPAKNSSINFFCRSYTAADLTNHLAVAVQAIGDATGEPLGPAQLASYTADASGNLATTSTAANMPKVGVGYVTRLAMSPNGVYLAVGGFNGIQIFAFHGGAPIQPFSAVHASGHVIQELYWDNAGHLYAISNENGADGRLFVYYVTPSSVTLAPGSPLAITDPLGLIVLPKTPVK